MCFGGKKKAAEATLVLAPLFEKLEENGVDTSSCKRKDGLIKPRYILTYNGTHVFYALCKSDNYALGLLGAKRGAGLNITNHAIHKGMLLYTTNVDVSTQADNENINYIYALVQQYM